MPAVADSIENVKWGSTDITENNPERYQQTGRGSFIPVMMSHRGVS